VGFFELDNGIFSRKKQITSYSGARKSTSKEGICFTELNTLSSLYKKTKERVQNGFRISLLMLSCTSHLNSKKKSVYHILSS
jgi:hypothetical protein